MDLSLKESSADLAPLERHCPQCQALVPEKTASCPHCGFTFPVGSEGSSHLPSADKSFGTLPALEKEAHVPVEKEPLFDAPTEVQLQTPAPSAEMPAAPSGALPAVTPPGPAVPPKRKIRMKALVIALVVVLVLGTGGGLAYLLTRPQPVISVTSDTASGSPLTVSPDAVLHISGHDFTANSTIVFLLDGHPAPDAHNAQSNSNGTVKADVVITDNWTFATHVLTARDAKDYVTKEGVTIKVIPAPVLTVSSSYFVGTTLAGSQATTFYITGKRFSPNASIKLLLDGTPPVGASPLISDKSGKFTTDLATSSTWTLGNHLLTAIDSHGYTTKAATPLVIVPAGQAGTPGPNGAPADNATFTLTVTVLAHTSQGKQLTPFTLYLTITGHPDPAGGVPCNTAYDNGQPHTYIGKEMNGKTYTDTETFSCTGSYQGGKLVYIEMLTSEHAIFANGDVCGTPHFSIPIVRMEGAFTTSTTATGTYSTYHLLFTCTSGDTWEYTPISGTWTGSL